MPRPTLDQIRGLGDFVTQYNWNLRFTDFPDIPGVPTSDQLNLRCISSDIPKATNEIITLRIKGHAVKQSGITIPAGPIVLTFLENPNMMVTQFIASWRNACYNMLDGTALTNEQVQATILLEELDRQDEPIYYYELVGCRLGDSETGGPLGSDASEVMRPSMTIEYDYFREGVSIS